MQLKQFSGYCAALCCKLHDVVEHSSIRQNNASTQSAAGNIELDHSHRTSNNKVNRTKISSTVPVANHYLSFQIAKYRYTLAKPNHDKSKKKFSKRFKYLNLTNLS